MFKVPSRALRVQSPLSMKSIRINHSSVDNAISFKQQREQVSVQTRTVVSDTLTDREEKYADKLSSREFFRYLLY